MVLLRKKATLDQNENLSGFLFLLPSLTGFVIFILFPIIFSLFLSLCEWDFGSGFTNIKFVGLSNYKDIATEVWFTDSLKNSLVFAATTVPIGISAALILAVIINKNAYFKSVLKTMFFMPYISSTVAVAIVWVVILHPSYGPVNELLKSFGIQNPPKWLVDTHWALPALIAMYIWQNLGYNIIVYISGLTSISKELYEAAEIDGANYYKKFFTITIPMVSPTTFFLVIMGIISSFKVFDQVQVLTSGGPGTSTTVLALYVYREAFQYYRMGYASSAAWIMFVIIFVVTLIQWNGQKKWVTYE